jgi:hypothetical protein
MQIRYVVGTKENSSMPIPLIRIEMTIEEAKDIERELLLLIMNSEGDTTKISGFISGMVAHLDQQEIPAMPGLQESLELINELRKLIDGRARVIKVKRSEFPFAKEYLNKEGVKFGFNEDVWNDTYTLVRKVKST